MDVLLKDILREGWFDMAKDPANIPMKGNALSPKAQYYAIQTDQDTFENSEHPKTDTAALDAKDRLAKDSEVGRYAVPGAGGDLGLFAGKKKGGAIKSHASKRADGCCKKGHTKGRMV